MPENTLNDQLNKKDLEVFLEVNKKAIEIETEVVGQNEEIIASLDSNKESHKEINGKLDKLMKQAEDLTKNMTELNKEIFKMQVLFVTGLLGIVAQIIQIFLKK